MKIEKTNIRHENGLVSIAYEEKPEILNEKKGFKKIKLDNQTITVNGKVLYCNLISKVDILSAIEICRTSRLKGMDWKLAEEFEGSRWCFVTVSEFKKVIKESLMEKTKIL